MKISLDDMKKQIEWTLDKEVKRAGREKLMAFLGNGDFYTAPASTVFHGAEAGGLAAHSYSVYELLKQKNKLFSSLGYSDESIAIVGICHDLCKINFYKLAQEEPATPAQINYLKNAFGVDGIVMSKNYACKLIDWYKNGKVGEMPKDGPTYEVDEQLPIGHGEKSLYILGSMMELTPDEAMAIRWHMIAFDAGIHFNYPSGLAFRNAIKKCPLITALFTADYESSNLYNL